MQTDLLRAALWQACAAALAVPMAFALTSTAQAQDRPAGVQKGESIALEEVVVTAQKRTENLQTTAIAASVLNNEALDKKGVVQIADLQNATPSLSITSAGLTSNVNIRGIGLSSGSPQVVPGVATYRDGLWEPPIVSTDTLYDIGSIEVLRGPQGTFVGSNSTGGAIFINSRSPDFNGLHGDVEVLGANYADFGARTAVNLPISETLAGRVAVNVERRDSFFNDIGSKLTPNGALFNHPGALDEKDARLGLLWQPTSDVQVQFKTEINDKSTGGYAYKPIPTTTYAALTPADPFTVNYDHYTLNDELSVRNSLQVNWTLPGGITLRSISGYQYASVHNIYDSDATSSTLPGPQASSEAQNVIERTMTQEFNLISPDTDRLQWIVGAFGMDDTREVGLNFQNQTFPPQILVNLFTTLKAVAVFGQVSYDIVPGLQLQVGLRDTHDSADSPPGMGANIGPGVAFVPNTGHHSENATTGKVALNWTVNDDNFLYAFAAKGFKAGGFDQGFPPVQFAPEFVKDYEIGWKSYFLDRRLRAQIGGFWNDYTDLQVSVLHPETGAVSLTNISKATIKGLEAQVEGRFGGLSIDFSGAYLKSKLGALTLVNLLQIPGGGLVNLGPQCAPGGPSPPACFDYTSATVSVSGRENPYSPKWTFNAGLEYSFNLADSTTLTPRVNYSYVGAQWTTLIEQPVTDYLAARGLWNASLTYQRGDWRVQGYGTNLSDKLYVTGQSGTNQFYGNPRQYGVRVSRSF